MAEYTVNGHEYLVRKLNAIDQFNLMRKLGPLIVKLGPSLKDVDTSSLDAMAQALAPMVETLAEMRDEDVFYITRMCYKVTRRVQEGGSTTVLWNERANMPQFDDIDLREMIQIIVAAVQENIGGFLADSRSDSTAVGAVGTSSS